MSAEHPIVAITGASDISSTSITEALQRIFKQERIKSVYISGSGFLRYERKQMRLEIAKARAAGRNLSHFSPAAAHLDKLESMFHQYAHTGSAKYRYYLHSAAFAQAMGQEEGTFTPWEAMDADNDLLLYRGLHGAMISGDIDLAQYPDLLVGAAPSVNLEWMRRIARDLRNGSSMEEIRLLMLERMEDYARHLAPQFSRTDVNFQLVPIVDTSDPFNFDRLPLEAECILVIHLRTVAEQLDIPALLARIPGAHMSRQDTLVIPGALMLSAVEMVLMPLIHGLIERSRTLRGITEVAANRGAGILGLKGQFD